MLSLSRIITALLFCVFLAGQVYAEPVKFIVDDRMSRDNVSFTSDAPIELIVGRTTKISGEIVVDDSLDLKKLSPTVDFEVDLASIDTGITLRDEHMRDNFLETHKYPNASFMVKNILFKDSTKLKDGEKIIVIGEGDFSVHGVTVKKKIPVKVTYLKESEGTHSRFPHGDVIRIQSTFDIKLDDHKIKRPEAVFQKLASKVIVTIDAFANEEIKGDNKND